MPPPSFHIGSLFSVFSGSLEKENNINGKKNFYFSLRNHLSLLYQIRKFEKIKREEISRNENKINKHSNGGERLP